MVAVIALAASGCTEIENAMASVPILNFMREAPSFDPYEAPRNAPPNAVPVEAPSEKWEPEVEATEVALNEWGNALTNPLPMEESVILRGARVFAINCSVCHGVTGVGDGPVVGPGKFPLATNLMLPTTQNRSDGYIYAVVRVGRGLMPSYQRIPPHDRWAVVNYVRYLQAGNDPILVDVPGTVQPGLDQFNTGGEAGGGAAPAVEPPGDANVTEQGAGPAADVEGQE